MKTANLIKVTNVRSMPSVVNYNLQKFKTTGKWPMQPWQKYNQNQLVTFHGNCARPDATIHGQGVEFIHQSVADRKFAHFYMGVKVHRNWTSGRTIVQSFDYKANPNLTPLTVHRLGNRLYECVKQYLQNEYGYHLSGGLVSTHLDQYGRPLNADNKSYLRQHGIKNVKYMAKDGAVQIRTKAPHLHNHIVIPNYNAEGQSICKYLRTKDIYQIQKIDDEITAHCFYYLHVPKKAYVNAVPNKYRHKLHQGIYMYRFKDYYFYKLRRKMHPISEYTRHPIHVVGNHKTRKHGKSNIQKACIAFNVANNHAWDYRYQYIRLYNRYYPRKEKRIKEFYKIRWGRNRYLRTNYGLRFRHHKDGMTHKHVLQFTLRYEFPKQAIKKSHVEKQPYYNMVDLNILAWRNQRDMKAERFARQLDFKSSQGRHSLYNKPVSYVRYKTVLHRAAQILPSIQKINSANDRRKNRVNVAKVYRATPVISQVYIRTNFAQMRNKELRKKSKQRAQEITDVRMKTRLMRLTRQVRARGLNHYYNNVDLINDSLSNAAVQNMNEYSRGARLIVNNKQKPQITNQQEQYHVSHSNVNQFPRRKHQYTHRRHGPSIN